MTARVTPSPSSYSKRSQLDEKFVEVSFETSTLNSEGSLPLMDGQGDLSRGTYRSIVSVPPPAKQNGMEMTNLLEDKSENGGIPEGEFEPSESLMKRVETTDMLNLTLHQSARNGDARSTEILVRNISSNKRKKVNQRDEEGVTPIHYAARYNHLSVVKILVDNEAYVHATDEDLLTPLHYAARYKRERQRRGSDANLEDQDQRHGPMSANHRKTTEMRIQLSPIPPSISPKKKRGKSAELIEVEQQESEGIPSSKSTDRLGLSDPVVDFLIQQGANINQEDKYGLTPLHYAAMRGNELATKQLLTYQNLRIEAEDKQGMRALHMAATHNQVEIVELLIEANAELRCKDNEDLTPLHCAAGEGNIVIVQKLFEAAAKQDGWVTISNMVTDRDCDQNTCLHLAVENGHFDVVRACLEKRADVNTPSANYMHPLHLAAKAGDLNCVRILVQHRARIDALNDEMATPLHIAAAHDHKEVVEFLVERRAPLEKKDKDNYTPLLMAAYSGHADVVDLLLKRGADYEAVDKNDKTAIYLAAEEDKVDAIKVMLSYPEVRKLMDIGDRYDNHPLHVAAQDGYLAVVKALLDSGADLDCKNEEEQTPLHLAAKYGRTNVVKEIVLRDKSSVNDEDENSDTPLHLAAINGHNKVAQVLIKYGADVAARNGSMWTPLDCAASKGRVKVAQTLLDADAPIDPMDKTKTTPLHLAAKNGHENVVICLLENHANVAQRDSDGNNCLDLAIDNNKEEAALAILNSDCWEDAMRNETADLGTGCRTTPMRKLIKKMPDVAEHVFLKCMQANHRNPEHKDYKVTFNYEFLDDTYSDWSEAGRSDPGSGTGSVYNEDFSLSKSAKAYTSDSSELKKNHPLMIMVSSKREDLLAHPLVSALLRHKWNSFGRVFYYLNFIIYAVFLVFLTGYILTTDPPFKYYSRSNVTSSVAESVACDAAVTANIQQDLFAKIGKYVIMALAAWNLLRELLQIYQAKLNYLGVENLMEWITYVAALLLVIDFETCQRSTGFRFNWQWSLGAMSIFLAWIDLVLFLQKFPRFGIYVVMFKDILNTFLSFFLVFVLFIVAFGFGFYALLQNQDPFATPWEALIKTTVMMIGEFEYETIFYSQESGHKDYHPEMTFIMFVVFLIIMSIILMNLLVGLAVDDIKAVQEKAALRRMAMQVDLALDVEKVVPEFIRRRFVVKCEKIAPNKGTLNPLKRLAAAESGDLSSESISKALNPDLDEIEKVQEAQEKLQKDVTKMKMHMKEIRAQNSRLEGMLASLLKSQDVAFDDEDFHDNLE